MRTARRTLRGRLRPQRRLRTPTTPSALALQVLGATSIRVTWTAGVSDHVQIRYTLTSGSDYDVAELVVASLGTYDLEDLCEASDYYVQIRGVIEGASAYTPYSAWSAEETATTD